ncbi:MAG TPA: IPT/TIG domain-containing protein, partial [Planctomycetota bacterium]|nr:IPT/TIG domain-containing protein [Planctomycetota bacterium]
MKSLRVATICLLLLPWPCSCGGSDGGGGPPETPIQPNDPPVITVPNGLTGTSPRYTFSLPAGGTQLLTFTATDPDSDPLLWQFSVPPNGAASAGLYFTTPVTGPTCVLEVRPVLAPAFVQLNLLVDDGHQHAVAIDLLVVRTGPPAITSVTPDNAFRNRAQKVTITGSALQLGGTANTTVGFDGLAPANLVVANDTTITCSTPTAAAIGGTIVGVAHQYGQAQLPESAFTMFEYPPAFEALDKRLDNNTVADFQLGLRGSAAHAVWRQGNAILHRV